MAMATVIVDVATVTTVEWRLLVSDLPLDLVAVRSCSLSQEFGASTKQANQGLTAHSKLTRFLQVTSIN